MNISELCEKTFLPSEIKNKVLAFVDTFNFDVVSTQLANFLIYEKMDKARAELQDILGNDPEHIKILACMLYASASAYDVYRQKGISDHIYFDTMKCYTRFIGETQKITGNKHFDRYWWTTRQAGCHLFRIGELEYEIKPFGNKTVIDMHIPSDADFSPSAVDLSLQMARTFLAEHYPSLLGCDFYCCSWLLDSQLLAMLNEKSNILNFQRRFEILDNGKPDTEFIAWLYRSDTTDYSALPENTSLQRNVKKHLISGGVIRNSLGRLICF